MPGRIDLQTIFENLLGSRNVYFQPPATVLTGFLYIEGKKVLKQDNPLITQVTEKKIIQIEKLYLISKNNSAACLSRFYNYYVRGDTADGSVLLDGEACGDPVMVTIPWTSDLRGRVEKLTLGFGGSRVKAKAVIRGA